MALKLSTGLRDALLDTAPFKTALDASRLKIYSGTVPATADAAEGTELVDIGSDAGDTRCHFASAASSGAITKNSDTWSATAGATGTATYFRLVVYTDTGANSATEVRLQGTVGTSGADLNMSSVSIVENAIQTVDTFTITMPAS